MRIVVPGPVRDVDTLEDLYDPGPGPLLRAGFVLSVDGSTTVDGQSGGLHTASDGQAFRALRATADAVVVGAGTARAEDYREVVLPASGRQWRAATGRPPEVPVVVVSRRLDLSPTARLFARARPVVVTCASAPRDRAAALAAVADVLVCGADAVDLREMVRALHDRGLTRLVCEGGASLLADLLAADLVDELCFTVAPYLLGGSPLLPSPTPLRRLQLRSVVDGGDGALLCRWGLVRGSEG